MPKILFNSSNPGTDTKEGEVVPGYKTIPKFFSSFEKFHGSSKLTTSQGQPNSTLKKCPPFLDSMISGYVIRLEAEISVEIKDGVQLIYWPTEEVLVQTHGINQIPSELVPYGYNPLPFKWVSKWQAITPKNYSTLFTHPINRLDLPFITLSGMVETDLYNGVVNFPFFIRDNFEGIIPKGTPIAQLIPIPREKWVSKIGVANQESLKKTTNILRSVYSNGYKSLWWRRKNYK